MTDTNENKSSTKNIQVGNTVIIIETVYGNQPIDDIFADYITEKVKEGDSFENVA